MRAHTRLRGLALICMLSIPAGVALAAPRLDPARPEDVIQIQRKLWCSVDDGRAVLLWSQGSVYSHIPGEPDRRLFNFQIWNARACKGFIDPKRGPGYRSVSREIMLYLDPQTNELLRTWRNPWTGETVNVVHTQNDPVNMPAPMFAYDEQGQPARFDATFIGGRVIASNEAPLFYDNPLGGEFQNYVGGKYHAMEMLNIYTYESELLDPRVRTLRRWSRSWKRISGFLPWMRMGDRPGALLFTAVGQRVGSIEQLPLPIRTALQTEFAKYQSPPPLDDARPNETSWTYFRRVLKIPAVADPVPAAPVPPPPTRATALTPAPLIPSSYDTDLTIDCARTAAAPLISWWHGRIYSRRAGERDRHLFSLERLRVSRCELLTDPLRGRGYRQVARELTLYLDPASGEPLREWRNPWTGVLTPVVDLALDPVIGSIRWERDEHGALQPGRSRFALTDRLLTGSDAAVTFAPHPLGGDNQDLIGGQLQLLDYATSESLLPAAGRRPSAQSDTVLSWGQLSPWLPWMRQGSAEGVLVTHAAGMQLQRLEQLPQVLRRAISASYPQFVEPPPLGETRASVTPWSLRAP
jgi:hypothetical protein